MKYLSAKHLIGVLAFFWAAPCQALIGNGTEADPYKITSVADLKAIPDETTDYFRLVNDIVDCSYIGKKFCGHFDGAGHSISLNISESESYYIDNGGLFASCSGATIENLTIKGAISISKRRSYIDAGHTYYNALGSWYEHYYLSRLRVGAICGNATSTTFKNVRNEASIKGVITKISDVQGYYTIGSDCAMGGLVGVARSCTLIRCSNEGPVGGEFGYIGYNSPDNAGLTCITNGVGALIGRDVNSSVTDSYAKSKVSCSGYNSCEGGLIGIGESSRLSNCYFDGQTSYAPFVGMKDGTVIIDCISRVKLESSANCQSCTNCYVALIAGEECAFEGVEYVKPEMFSMQSWYASNLPSWDFSDVWYMPSGSDAMPLLRTDPLINWEGSSLYGGSVEFKSTNPYSKLVVEPANENEITVDGARITFLKAGSVTVNVRQDAVTPFKPVNRAVTFNVDKVNLVITARDCTMNYGDEPSAENILEYTGFIGTDTPESLEEMPNVVFGGSSTSDVGKYNIMVSGASSPNYSITYNKGIQTIEPRVIIVKPMNANRIYGNPNPQFKLEFEGWVNGHNESMVSQYPAASTQADSKSYAGDYVITVRGGEIHPNYKFQYLTGILTVDKAQLVIGVKNVIRNQNEFNPEFELTFSGFKNGDDRSSLDELPSISCEATYDSPEGVYPILLSGGSDKNYLFDLRNGTLVVGGESGIEDIRIDSDVDTAARYFTITGVEIRPNQEGKLNPGVYIKIINNKKSKVHIR